MTPHTITPIMANAVLAHVDERHAVARRARAAAQGRRFGRRRSRRALRPGSARRLGGAVAA